MRAHRMHHVIRSLILVAVSVVAVACQLEPDLESYPTSSLGLQANVPSAAEIDEDSSELRFLVLPSEVFETLIQDSHEEESEPGGFPDIESTYADLLEEGEAFYLEESLAEEDALAGEIEAELVPGEYHAWLAVGPEEAFNEDENEDNGGNEDESAASIESVYFDATYFDWDELNEADSPGIVDPDNLLDPVDLQPGEVIELSFSLQRIPEPEEPEDGLNISVSGTVFDPLGEEPVGGASIAGFDGEELLFETESEPDGEFSDEFVVPEELEGEEIDIQASAAGYSGETLTLEVAEEILDLIFQLPLEEMIVTGVVTDLDSGEGVEGAEVTLLEGLFEPAELEGATTDADGQYELEFELPPEPALELEVTSEGYLEETYNVENLTREKMIGKPISRRN